MCDAFIYCTQRAHSQPHACRACWWIPLCYYSKSSISSQVLGSGLHVQLLATLPTSIPPILNMTGSYFLASFTHICHKGSSVLLCSHNMVVGQSDNGCIHHTLHSWTASDVATPDVTPHIQSVCYFAYLLAEPLQVPMHSSPSLSKAFLSHLLPGELLLGDFCT